MIIQRSPGRLVCIRQVDHAHLAGDLARSWGNETHARIEPWAALETACDHHDDGWEPWDAAPSVGPDGSPYDFLTVPTMDRLHIYRSGVDAVEHHDLHVRILVSMHLTGLLLGRYEQGTHRKIDDLAGEERQEVIHFIEAEEDNQQTWMKHLDQESVWAQYRLLQMFDRFSLTLTMQPLEAGVMPVSPWPFSDPHLDLSVRARTIDRDTFDSNEGFRDLLAEASLEEIPLRIHAG